MLLKKIFIYLSKRIYCSDFNKMNIEVQKAYHKYLSNDILLNAPLLKQLLISGEDHRFRHHLGFDFYAICRAFKNNLFHSKNEGASTIDQQLVRVLINDYSRTPKRKIKEIFLAVSLSEIIPRKDIPFIYLQTAYYGTKFQTIESLFQKYNIQRSNDITLDIAAQIIARIKYPEPVNSSEKKTMLLKRREKHLLSLHYKHKAQKFIKVYD